MKITKNESYLLGVANLKKIDRDVGEEVIENLSEISPELSQMIVSYVFGEIYERPTIDLRTKEIAIVSSLIALDKKPQLKVHLNAALNVGLSISELHEIIIQMSVYCGFPSAVEAAKTYKEVLDQRRLGGKIDEVGVKGKSTPEEEKLNKGKEILQELGVVSPESLEKAFQDVSPDFLNYVFQFGFGEVVSRSGLGLREREIATIAALTALGVKDALKFHIQGALNLGISKAEIAEVLITSSVFCGFPKATTGIMILKELQNE
ncbi:carboxymuconolactone decarboxylase family protein [Flagellimonas sp.]|uniref:carboxymuconolactone decarboxylase family protein n=1 Tax=Flagellimonas sp. TaxID=2058762 RepID=UPI003BAFEE4D